MLYTEELNDNNEYFAKIQPLLAQGRKIEPDIIAPTGWLAGRLIGLEWVDKLPLDDIPNKANLRDDLVEPAWDPTGEYTLPWQAGIVGIAYNRAATGRDLASTADLFDPAFRGKIGMLLEMRDTMGLLMLLTGADPSQPTFEDADEAFRMLEEAVDAGQVRRFTGNDYQDELVAGDFVACVGWSGDVAQLALENEDLRFVLPGEGGMSFADVMVMPKGTENVDSVAAWMNFVYDPVNAARITAEIQYPPAVKGVDEELRKLGGEAAALVDNPLVFPDEATLASLHEFGNMPEEEELRFDERFSQITGV
jgi:spermidine/putrescine transport system substrate-binding protein